MSTICILGEEVRPLETIERVGRLLGYRRTTAFKASEGWPLHGPKGNRRVVVPALADQLGIPYDVKPEPQVGEES